MISLIIILEVIFLSISGIYYMSLMAYKGQDQFHKKKVVLAVVMFGCSMPGVLTCVTGDLQEKVDPYLRPLYDALYQIMGAETFLKNMEKGLIEVAPLAYMRGRTLDNAYIILDEAQNTTPAQMKMFLTRIGFGSKVIVTGDASQKDLPSGTRSGLDVAMQVLKKVDGISFCELTSKDVVRHPLVQKIVQAYDEYEKKAKPENHSGRAKSTTRKRRENK